MEERKVKVQYCCSPIQGATSCWRTTGRLSWRLDSTAPCLGVTRSTSANSKVHTTTRNRTWSTQFSRPPRKFTYHWWTKSILCVPRYSFLSVVNEFRTRMWFDCCIYCTIMNINGTKSYCFHKIVLFGINDIYYISNFFTAQIWLGNVHELCNCYMINNSHTCCGLLTL